MADQKIDITTQEGLSHLRLLCKRWRELLGERRLLLDRAQAGDWSMAEEDKLAAVRDELDEIDGAASQFHMLTAEPLLAHIDRLEKELEDLRNWMRYPAMDGR